CTYEGYMPYTDRVDYVAAMTANHVWALAVEKLAGLEVPERAEYLRVISDEICRISSHAIGVGAMAMDIGATTPFMYILREGDCWDRYYVRIEEWKQSVRMLRQALDQIDKTDKKFWIPPKKLKPKGDAYVRCETARGDMGCYVVGDGATNAYRVRFRTGSFNA